MAERQSARYGSDVMAEAIRGLGIEYVAFNPGSSFRGLHDSFVNHLGNHDPELILCCHEAIAVSMAQGYAKTTGKPMAALVHDTVGLLNATNSIYDAWLDQAPVIVLGGNGPMAVEERRPWIDWIHTSLVPANLVRDYVKWDDQPFSLAGVPDAIMRGFRVAMTEPRGPVYICLDAGLQEEEAGDDIVPLSPERYRPPAPPAASPSAIDRAAELLVAARNPVVIADYLGRNPDAVPTLIELAELLALPVVDRLGRFNFPSTHPLDLTGASDEIVAGADVVLALDAPDLHRYLSASGRTRRSRSLIDDSTQVIHITLHDLGIKSWPQSYGGLVGVDLPIAADTSVAVPALTAACRALLAGKERKEIEERFERLSARHRALVDEWQETCRKCFDDRPISLPRLASEIGRLLKGEEWVSVNRDLNGWARRMWDWEKPSQYTSRPTGLGCGLGQSLGAALAHRASERLCIDLQPDGDFMFAPQALWTAARHRIPLLVVMFNNRSYYNSEAHQQDVARQRGRAMDNAVLGTRMEDPVVDYAALARSFGLHGEGPIESPEELRPALERAVKVVKGEGRLALVDVITQNR